MLVTLRLGLKLQRRRPVASIVVPHLWGNCTAGGCSDRAKPVVILFASCWVPRISQCRVVSFVHSGGCRKFELGLLRLRCNRFLFAPVACFGRIDGALIIRLQNGASGVHRWIPLKRSPLKFLFTPVAFIGCTVGALVMTSSVDANGVHRTIPTKALSFKSLFSQWRSCGWRPAYEIPCEENGEWRRRWRRAEGDPVALEAMPGEEPPRLTHPNGMQRRYKLLARHGRQACAAIAFEKHHAWRKALKPSILADVFCGLQLALVTTIAGKTTPPRTRAADVVRS